MIKRIVEGFGREIDVFDNGFGRCLPICGLDAAQDGQVIFNSPSSPQSCAQEKAFATLRKWRNENASSR